MLMVGHRIRMQNVVVYRRRLTNTYRIILYFWTTCSIRKKASEHPAHIWTCTWLYYLPLSYALDFQKNVYSHEQVIEVEQ